MTIKDFVPKLKTLHLYRYHSNRGPSRDGGITPAPVGLNETIQNKVLRRAIDTVS
jgi:hypothetical protein